MGLYGKPSPSKEITELSTSDGKDKVVFNKPTRLCSRVRIGGDKVWEAWTEPETFKAEGKNYDEAVSNLVSLILKDKKKKVSVKPDSKYSKRWEARTTYKEEKKDGDGSEKEEDAE